jgi:hypothetical protein
MPESRQARLAPGVAQAPACTTERGRAVPVATASAVADNRDGPLEATQLPGKAYPVLVGMDFETIDDANRHHGEVRSAVIPFVDEQGRESEFVASFVGNHCSQH